MDKIRGINLGGWFVLEKWMKPSLFEGLSALDETRFVQEHPQSHQTLQTHWGSFIQESDIQYLKSLGINSVRLPIPWWLLGESPYFRSIDYIDELMRWCDLHEMAVLLDLHTAPGCQNGFDNGGIKGQIGWHTNSENINKTVKIIGQIADHFSRSPSLWGIQVLNEPHWTIPITQLQQFYLDAYHEIRKYAHVEVVFHDGFRPLDETWKSFFTTNHLVNVSLDVHYYSVFGSYFEKLPLKDIIQTTISQRTDAIHHLSTFVKVIVGEWSLGLHPHLFEGMDTFERDTTLRLFANAQLNAYEQGFGWYFWNYTIDDEKVLHWDFKKLVDKGIMPTNYFSKEGK